MPLGIISPEEFESELSNCVIQSDPVNNNPRAPVNNPTNSSDSNSISNEDNDEIQAINSATIITRPRGRGESNTQVPLALRKIIGETSAINGRSDAVELADMFGISKSSVSAYKEGAHSTATINEPNKNTRAHIDASKLRVTARATKRLNLALTHITSDKLAEAKVGEIASVAKAMAGVIKDMSPDSSDNDKKSQTPFVVFAPIIKNENQFEVVMAKDDY
jgi:hypothetical protein